MRASMLMMVVMRDQAAPEAPQTALFAPMDTSAGATTETAPTGLWGRWVAAFDRVYTSTAAWLGFGG